MAVTQVALNKMSAGNEYFNLLTKAGIAFDYIALMCLLALTNGVLSPLFPIAYLVVMHAAIYWRTKGAILSSISLTAGYSTIFSVQAQFDFNTTFVFILNLVFIWIIGVFGSLIVIRERKHLKQKEIFHELMLMTTMHRLSVMVEKNSHFYCQPSRQPGKFAFLMTYMEGYHLRHSVKNVSVSQ